ncbi:MAG: hypothetical protein JNK63_01165 [Chthonomonas sp.]|nr:hypothetical protein [Chthonomonas sp.]
MRRQLFVLSLLGLCVSPAHALIRRIDVADSQYQALAANIPLAWIQYSTTANPVSGALIGDKFILSAAHTQTTGTHTIKLAGETYTIVAWVRHPSYSGSNILGGFDFSVARLDRRVLNIAPLPVRSAAVPSQTPIKIFGMGVTGLGNGTGYVYPWSPIPASWPLRGATNLVDVDTTLPNIFMTDFDKPDGTTNSLSTLGSSAQSTSTEGQLIWGDSGGPVTMNVSGQEQIVAVNSALSNYNGNSSTGDFGDLSIFARVSTAYSWIMSNAWEAGRVAGKINLADFIGSPMLRTATIELRNVGSTTAIETFTVPLAVDSSFSFVTPRRGATDIKFTIPGFCSRVLSNVMISDTAPGNLNVLLPNGDPDQSQEVDASDIDLVISNFGSLTTSATSGDLNGSGEVDASDIDVCIGNFGQTGQP